MRTLAVFTALSAGALVVYAPSAAIAAAPLTAPDTCGATPNAFAGANPQGNATRTYIGTITGNGATRNLAIKFGQGHIVYNAQIWTDDGAENSQVWYFYELIRDVRGVGDMSLFLPQNLDTADVRVRCAPGTSDVIMIKGVAGPLQEDEAQFKPTFTFKIFSPR